MPTGKSFVLRAAVILAVLAMFAACGGGDTESPQAENIQSGPMPGETLPEGEEAPPMEESKELDEIVARVNGVDLDARRVVMMASAQRLELQAMGRVLTDEEAGFLLGSTLNMLIDMELVIQEAEAQGLTVEQEKLDEELQRIKGQYESVEAYEKHLESSGVTEERLRKEARRNLLLQKYREYIGAGVTVPESEVEKYYNEHKELFTGSGHVRASQILVRFAADDPQEQKDNARKRIEEVQERLAAGEEFAVLAKEYSQTNSAEKGGDLGFFPKGKMVPEFERLAFSMKVGEVSPIFETSYGYNIIKVTDTKAPQLIPFEAIKADLTLNMVNQKVMEKLSAKVGELRGKATIEILESTFFPGGVIPEPPVAGQDAKK